MPNPTDPAKDLTKALAASATEPARDSTQLWSCSATDPAKDPTQVRSLSATDPAKDPTRLMSAILQEGTCGNPACCCCEGRREPGPRPFGLPALPLTEVAIQARAGERLALLRAAKELIVQLHKAHLAGSITPADLQVLHSLQGWYSLLQAEQDAATRKR